MPSKLATAWEKVSLRSKLTGLSVAIIGLLLLVSSFQVAGPLLECVFVGLQAKFETVLRL